MASLISPPNPALFISLSCLLNDVWNLKSFVYSSPGRQLNQNVDERGRNFMCKCTLPNLLVIINELKCVKWRTKNVQTRRNDLQTFLRFFSFINGGRQFITAEFELYFQSNFSLWMCLLRMLFFQYSICLFVFLWHLCLQIARHIFVLRCWFWSLWITPIRRGGLNTAKNFRYKVSLTVRRGVDWFWI